MLSKARTFLVDVRSYTESAILPAVVVYTLGAFGGACLSSTHVYLMEQSICRQHFSYLEPARIGKWGLMDEEMCKIPEIQKVVAEVHGVYNFLNFLPALFLTGPYDRIAQILGKKFILFLNALSLALGGVYFTAVYYYQFPVQWIYFTPFFDVIGGGSVIMSSFTYGYIAESVDSKDLSEVFYKFSAAQLLVAFLGMSLSSYLLRSQVWALCLIGVISMGFTVPITYLLPDSERSTTSKTLFPPVPLDGIADTYNAASETSSLLSSNSSAIKVTSEDDDRGTLKTIFHALTSNYADYLSPFKNIFYSSLLSKTTLLIYVLVIIGTGIRVISAQWGSLTFNWILADVNAVCSLEMIISGIVLLFFPPSASNSSNLAWAVQALTWIFS